MKVHEHFSEILALPGSIVMAEAKAKFKDTMMYINGAIETILDIEANRLHIMGESGEHRPISGDEIEIIKPFLPDSGVYIIKNTPHILWRVTKRQWKKSFCWSFYEANKPLNVYAIKESERLEIYFYKGKIFYWQNAIGRLSPKTNKFECTNSVFQFEFDKFVKGNKVEIQH